MLAEKWMVLHPPDRLRQVQAPLEPEATQNEKYCKTAKLNKL